MSLDLTPRLKLKAFDSSDESSDIHDAVFEQMLAIERHSTSFVHDFKNLFRCLLCVSDQRLAHFSQCEQLPRKLTAPR